MKMSTKGRYALRIMLDLAVYNTGAPVTLKDIAKRQQISEKYLEQIMSLLIKAGYVRSMRGAFGGYLLKQSPCSYTVGMILRKAEGELSIVNKEDEVADDPYVCSATCKVWDKMNNALSEVVDNITLEDMLEWRREAVEEASFDYVI